MSSGPLIRRHLHHRHQRLHRQGRRHLQRVQDRRRLEGCWRPGGRLINYTTEELDGTITAGQYGEPAGRITIVDEPANYPADLETGSWYYNAAVYALDNGIADSTNKDFEPTGTVTRATVYPDPL